MLINPLWAVGDETCGVIREEISDECWAVIGPWFPSAKRTGRPPLPARMVVEAAVFRFRAGVPWRDVPQRFGKWNSLYTVFRRWALNGTWARVLALAQSRAGLAGDLEWVLSVDSTISRVHQHGATTSREPHTGGLPELQEF